jgi:hypothetical protein
MHQASPDDRPDDRPHSGSVLVMPLGTRELRGVHSL